MIRVVYATEPKFPAVDQHPDAKRAQIGPYWVDYIGAVPTLQDVQAMLPGPRRQRGIPAIAADIALLSNTDRNRLIAAVCAVVLRQHPKLARELGLLFDGDEPDA